MTPQKRLLDLLLAGAGLLLLAPVLLVLAPVLLVLDGRPLLYAQERAGQGGRPFRLLKLRTMRPDPADAGVTGADKAARITRAGAWLRRTRLDEAPQLLNVLRGEMSLVGPRPPLPSYVARFPELYGPVLDARPGITGLATALTAGAEERLLARARTAAETEAVYVRTCVPRKARLDLIYLRERSLCFDLWILCRTLTRNRRRRATPGA